MPKSRSSSGKRDREFKKRERERMKREKAALKRQRRDSNKGALTASAPDMVRVTEAQDQRFGDQDTTSSLLEDTKRECGANGWRSSRAG